MLGTNSMEINKISIIKPTPQKTCKCFGATCSFCRQQAPHPLPVQLDQSRKDWDGNKAKAREQNTLLSFDMPKPETDKQTSDSVDTPPFQNLTIKMNRLDEKAPEVSTTLVSPIEPGVIGTTPKEDSITKAEDRGLTEQELRLQREEEKYAMYISHLSPKDSDTDTEMDKSEYPFYD